MSLYQFMNSSALCLKGIRSGTACCDAACGDCGGWGSGCSGWPGGRRRCCVLVLSRESASPCRSPADVACRLPDNGTAGAAPESCAGCPLCDGCPLASTRVVCPRAYLEWTPWTRDMRNGLSHQLSSLSCALGEAYYTGRTLLLPRSGLCSSKGHVARWAAGGTLIEWRLETRRVPSPL